jgi:hypothetical protein
MCWRCRVKFDPDSLIECGLTGNEPLEFGFKLNRYTDPDGEIVREKRRA